MTVAMLMENTLQSAIRHWEASRALKVKPLKLNLLENVPSDIEIAMAQTPKPIAHLSREIGLLPDELESYGKYKAKVDLGVLKRLAHRKNGKYIIVSGYVIRLSKWLQSNLKQYNTNAIGRGQIYNHYWFGTSFGGRTWSPCICLRSPTQSRTHIWHQRRGSWRRL